MTAGAVRRWLRRLADTFRFRSADREMEREVQAHLVLLEDDFRRRGLTPAAARAAARRSLGNLTQLRELHRTTRAFGWIDDARTDVRYAVRTLAKSPVSVGVVVLSIALSAGATAAVYGTADFLFSRPPRGVVAPDHIVTLELHDATRPERGVLGMSFPQIVALQPLQDAFVDVAAYGRLSGVISTDTRADQIGFEYVTGNYFSLLGVRPAAGRLLTSDDDRVGGPAVAVISYALWQSRFGGDPGVVDRQIRLRSEWCRVVGVAPEGFEGYPFAWNGIAGVWLPINSPGALRGLAPTDPQPFFRALGRLRPGTSVEAARDKAQAWLPALPPVKVSSFNATDIVVTPSSENRLGGGRKEAAQTFLGLVLTLCGLVMLAGCANLANFLVGRAVTRRRELAMRSALGATRARLVRQLMTEAILLGTGAGVLGIVAAIWLGKALATLPRTYLNLALTNAFSTAAAVDVRMAAVAVLLGLTTSILFGLIPAWMGSFRDPLRDLKAHASQWSWAGVRLTAGQVVTTLQIALAVSLAVVAGVLGRSVYRVTAIETGYNAPESVLLARIIPGGLGDRTPAFYDALFDRLNARPEVVSASIGWNPPFMTGGTVVETPGQGMPVQAGATAVAPRFYETQGIPVVAGREFLRSDRTLDDGVIVNRVLADRLWPGGVAVGQPILYGVDRVPSRVVGVVDELRCQELIDEPRPCMAQPFPWRSSGYLRVRTTVEPMSFVPVLRNVVHELSPDVAVAEETNLETFLVDHTRKQRVAATTAVGFALFGMLLAGIGCVSLFLSMVRDSVREIAIRMALGASHRRLTTRIILQSVPLFVLGSAAGLVVAYAASQRLAGLLYQTRPADPLVFATVPAAIGAVVLASVMYSAWVATRVEPSRTLRSE